MGNPTAFTMISAQEAFQKKLSDPNPTLEEWKKQASNNATCCNCSMPVWRFADMGMCFTCITGESDASDDYELILEIDDG
jgi:hypothetical protein